VDLVVELLAGGGGMSRCRQQAILPGSRRRRDPSDEDEVGCEGSVSVERTAQDS
jgi:hypothetical protein